MRFTNGQKYGEPADLEAPIEAYFRAIFCDCGTHDEPHLIQSHATMTNVLNDADKS